MSGEKRHISTDAALAGASGMACRHYRRDRSSTEDYLAANYANDANVGIIGVIGG
jgi:hypothetical protein